MPLEQGKIDERILKTIEGAMQAERLANIYLAQGSEMPRLLLGTQSYSRSQGGQPKLSTLVRVCLESHCHYVRSFSHFAY